LSSAIPVEAAAKTKIQAAQERWSER
jgi:hypothetical protein